MTRHSDLLTNRVMNQFIHINNHIIDIHNAQHGRLTLGDPQQLPGQFGCPHASLLSAGDTPLRYWVIGQFKVKQFEVAHYNPEDIIKVMGNTTR